MRIQDCKRGDVVSTGDSYGMSPCICIRSFGKTETYSFETAEFIDLTTGVIHESSDNQYGSDDCIMIDRISEEQVQIIENLWGEYRENLPKMKDER